MNDYMVDWPFWGGAGIGLCVDDDPALPPELAARARAWAATFNEQFGWEYGWPDQTTASAHEAEGERLHRAIQRALPEHVVEFVYWERDVDGR